MLKNLTSLDNFVTAYKTDEYGGYSINFSAGSRFTIMESRLELLGQAVLQLQQEQEFRKAHPAAQDAYDKYMTVVALCKDADEVKPA